MDYEEEEEDNAGTSPSSSAAAAAAVASSLDTAPPSIAAVAAESTAGVGSSLSLQRWMIEPFPLTSTIRILSLSKSERSDAE